MLEQFKEADLALPQNSSGKEIQTVDKTDDTSKECQKIVYNT